MVSDPYTFWENRAHWYKGNLHTHTTNSDGDLSPSEMVKEYVKCGYDFLCVTDHAIRTEVEEIEKGDILLLGGEEIGTKESYHLVAINTKEQVTRDNISAEEAIRDVKSQGGEVIFAHPHWSMVEAERITELKGILGIEIYNTSCDWSIGKGYSEIIWDFLLAAGTPLWGFATDDAHWHFNSYRPNDACGAWIMVNAKSKTAQDILNSIRKGRFYASTGPEILVIDFKNDKIEIRTTPVERINFIADGSKGRSFTPLKRGKIQSATYQLTGEEKYLRIECWDEKYRKAWTNPIFLKT